MFEISSWKMLYFCSVYILSQNRHIETYEDIQVFHFTTFSHPCTDVCCLWAVSGLTPGVAAAGWWKLQRNIINCPLVSKWSPRCEGLVITKEVLTSFSQCLKLLRISPTAFFPPYSHTTLQRDSITNITHAPRSAVAEIEVSLAIGRKSNWMFYYHTKLQ